MERGTGLGLATIFGIVRQHGGWIEVASAVGEGTTFQVFLPALKAPARKIPPAEKDESIRGHGETILLVEDEAPLRILARTALERYGYQSPANYREIFRVGLVALDAAARAASGDAFAAMAPEAQDELIAAIAAGQVDTFTEPSAKVFFSTMRDHVIEGFFADPVYGGNHDMVGWRLVGYPGAQRAYTPDDIHGDTPLRPPQSLADMAMLHPTEADGDNSLLPVSGSDHRGHD